MKKYITSRRMVSLLLGLFLLCAPFGSATTAETPADTHFTDTSDPRAAVLDKLHIMSGYPDGSFRPAGYITRGEFAAVVCRLINEAPSAEALSGGRYFDDVAPDHWAAGYIGYASQSGIVNGVGEKLFQPEGQVTRAQACKMIIESIGYEHEETLAAGYPEGYLRAMGEAPTAADPPITRIEAAELLSRALFPGRIAAYHSQPGQPRVAFWPIDRLIGPLAPEPALKKQILKALILEYGADNALPRQMSDDLYPSQLSLIHTLNVTAGAENPACAHLAIDTKAEPVTNLEGLAYMIHLRELNIEQQAVADLSPLAEQADYAAACGTEGYALNLRLYGNRTLTDLTPLRAAEGLKEGITVATWPATADLEALQRFYFLIPGNAARDIDGYEAMYERILAPAAAVLEEIVTPAMSDREKALAIHDYIISHCTYHDEIYRWAQLFLQENTEALLTAIDALREQNPDFYEAYIRSHTPDGVLLDGSAVCDGYAKAFYLLCDGANIPCSYITGSVPAGSHAWNSVLLDGQELFVDCTWDDTDGRDPHAFCLVSRETIEADHTEEQRELSSGWQAGE